jgi:hypothetical protein
LLEPRGTTVVVDRRPVPLELVGAGMVEPGGDEETVERELEVEAAGAAVADRHPELLLERRPGMKAGVVVGPEGVGLAEVRELLREGESRLAQVRVVSVSVGSEPVAIVVVLELAEEVERVGRPHV